MTQPTNAAVHVDSALTNISVAFLQNASHFVAGRVFPNVPVQKQSDRYFVFDRGFFNRDEAAIRAPGTESKGSGYELDNTPTYFANVYAYHHDVADQVRANADAAVDPERAAAELVTHKMLIRKEADWVSKFFAGGIWTGGDVDGVSATPGTNQVVQWSDTTSGDPIGDIRAAKTSILESTGFIPNTMVFTQPVFDALIDHPDIVDRIKYGQTAGGPAMANEQTLAALLGLDRILISRAIRNTAAEGAANAHSFIAGKKALLCYTPSAPSLMAPAAGYTFSWTGFMGQTNGFGFATKRFRMEHLESTRVEGQMAFDHKLVSSDLGYFFDSIVA